ncbi:hypothetical protein EUGRSUZ_K00560 [Eucalyptus grandis]|uniref:Uncharacterized protein n=2 Tax=Eucalyptus grandis TaxID=71139 RepID=A0ACC3IQP6_EUCGR|nr:hypothetical protein EUGRSUZ_K00560 [Eucalyptus grandis]
MVRDKFAFGSMRLESSFVTEADFPVFMILSRLLGWQGCGRSKIGFCPFSHRLSPNPRSLNRGTIPLSACVWGQPSLFNSCLLVICLMTFY